MKKATKQNTQKKPKRGGGGWDQGWEESTAALAKVGKHEDMKTNFKI